MLGVSVSTIQKMVEAGKLRAWRTQGGHRRIAHADVAAMGRDGKPGSISGSAQVALRVLVVEDNNLMLKAYARAAAKFGARIDMRFAHEAAAALIQIAQSRPNLVVTDLAMQPFDGFHLIRTLRGSPDLAQTRILVVTGLSDDEIAARGGLDALTVCYRKPLSFERFEGYIDSQLQERLHGL